MGANTCRATATFARIGLRAVALDISMIEMQGLRTADWWFQEQGTYFERVLAQMSALPFADNSFDWVFCCEVLHHNSPQGILMPSAKCIACCAQAGACWSCTSHYAGPPTSSAITPPRSRFAGNKHVYFFSEYL
jgi:hypothetical protein